MISRFLLLFSVVGGILSSAQDPNLVLSGTLIKRIYSPPTKVDEPGCGWYLELDETSCKTLSALHSRLSPEQLDETACCDLTTDIIQLVIARGDERAWCLLHEGMLVKVGGPVPNPPYPLSALPTYQLFQPQFLLPNDDPYTVLQLSDAPLELPEGHPEIEVTLVGRLRTRLCPGPPNYTSTEAGDYPSYLTFLEMEPASLRRALQKPVDGLGLSPQEILAFANCNEVQLVFDSRWEMMMHQSSATEITGTLWHAHTAHHRAPFVLMVKSARAKE